MYNFLPFQVAKLSHMLSFERLLNVSGEIKQVTLKAFQVSLSNIHFIFTCFALIAWADA